MYSNLFGNSTSFQTLYMLQGEVVDVVARAHTLTSGRTDLKLGQYIKLPPRMTFVAQIVSTLESSLIGNI